MPIDLNQFGFFQIVQKKLFISFFQNKWVPRTSESGPKTLEEVHDEARREEMANRLQREQVRSSKFTV